MNNKTLKSSIGRLSLAVGSMINKLVLIKTQKSPKYIGDYQLVKYLTKTDVVKNLTLGVYKKGDKNFFIKTWHGGLKDIGYGYLINEYTQAILMSEVTKNSQVLHTSIPVEIIEKNGSVSAVYQFIEGEALINRPFEEQVKVLAKTIVELRRISINNQQLKKYLPVQNKQHFRLTLVLVCLAFLFKKPSLIKWIWKRYQDCLNALKLESKSHQLAHKDLTPENIIISGNKIFLVDGEDYVLTLPGYDLSGLYSHPEYKSLAIEVGKVTNTTLSQFLIKLLPLQYLIGGGNFLSLSEKSTDILLKAYGE